ncbi:unnamed protein product, partial [Protopolystoma xenopodis]
MIINKSVNVARSLNPSQSATFGFTGVHSNTRRPGIKEVWSSRPQIVDIPTNGALNRSSSAKSDNSQRTDSEQDSVNLERPNAKEDRPGEAEKPGLVREMLLAIKDNGTDSANAGPGKRERLKELDKSNELGPRNEGPQDSMSFRDSLNEVEKLLFDYLNRRTAEDIDSESWRSRSRLARQKQMSGNGTHDIQASGHAVKHQLEVEEKNTLPLSDAEWDYQQMKLSTISRIEKLLSQ